MIKKMMSTLCAMIFCLGLLPIAAYAVERGGGHTEGTVTEPAQLAVDATGTEPASGCICTELCTGDNINGKSASCSVTVTHGNMVHTPKKDATCQRKEIRNTGLAEPAGRFSAMQKARQR